MTAVACGNCGETYYYPEPTRPVAEVAVAVPLGVVEAVRYQPLRTPCPKCGSTRLRTGKKITDGSTTTTRRHKCRNCGHPFKSAEAAARS